MEKHISGRFDFANRLYWWVPPVAVIIALGIDNVIAESGATIEIAFLVWIFSMSSVLFYHSGLIIKNWRGFQEDEVQQKLEGLQDMLSPGNWLGLVFVHTAIISIAIIVWPF